MIGTCSRSEELRKVLLLGHWPDACGSELRAHVTACASCADVVLITQHLQTARTRMLAAVPVGSANLLWLRAQARRRQAALERAARPVAMAQAFALLVGLFAAVGVAAMLWRGAGGSHASLSVANPMAALSSIATNYWMLELCAGAAVLLLLGGVALFLTSERLEKNGR